MANESVVAAFTVALQAALITRLATNPNSVTPDWSKSTVYLGRPRTPDISLDDCIVLFAGRTSAPQRYATNTRSRDQQIALPCLLQGWGEGATAFTDALTRAELLLDEVAGLLRDSPPGAGSIPVIGQRKAIVEQVEFSPPAAKDAGGYACLCRFVVATDVRVA